MAKKYKVRISGLNIVTQPHTPDGYVEIFKYFKSQKPYVIVQGSDTLKLIDIAPLDGKSYINGIKGKILKYTNIDANSTWVNAEDGKELKDDEVPDLPNNAFPHGALFDFVFYPKKENATHKLFYISRYRDSTKKKYNSLSPKFLKKFFDIVFQNRFFTNKFSSVETTVIPARYALEQLFNLEIIKKIEIVIKAPNPDDFDEIESNLLARMEEMNVSQIDETLHYDGQSIHPDERIYNDARVAQENGFVRVSGMDRDGMNTSLSTSDIPLSEEVELSSNTTEARLSALTHFNL